MRKIIVFSLLAIAAFNGCNQASDLNTTALNGGGDTQKGQALYTELNCAACHGSDGKTSALGVSRIIAEIEDPRDIENALFTLRDAPIAERDSAMVGIASTLSEEDILSLSAFISTL